MLLGCQPASRQVAVRRGLDGAVPVMIGRPVWSSRCMVIKATEVIAVIPTDISPIARAASRGSGDCRRRAMSFQGISKELCSFPTSFSSFREVTWVRARPMPKVLSQVSDAMLVGVLTNGSARRIPGTDSCILLIPLPSASRKFLSPMPWVKVDISPAFNPWSMWSRAASMSSTVLM